MCCALGRPDLLLSSVGWAADSSHGTPPSKVFFWRTSEGASRGPAREGLRVRPHTRSRSIREPSVNIDAGWDPHPPRPLVLRKGGPVPAEHLDRDLRSQVRRAGRREAQPARAPTCGGMASMAYQALRAGVDPASSARERVQAVTARARPLKPAPRPDPTTRAYPSGRAWTAKRRRGPRGPLSERTSVRDGCPRVSSSTTRK